MTNVKQARKQKKLTVYDVAEHVGITAGAVSRIERGLLGISPSNAKKMADLLDLKLEQVLFPEEISA